MLKMCGISDVITIAANVDRANGVPFLANQVVQHPVGDNH